LGETTNDFVAKKLTFPGKLDLVRLNIKKMVFDKNLKSHESIRKVTAEDDGKKLPPQRRW